MPFLLSSEIRIDVGPDAVWSVLMMTEAWPLWTDWMAVTSGAFVKGARVRLSMAELDGGRFDVAPRVTSVVPARRLQWVRRTGGVPYLLDSKRDFVLTEGEEGGSTLLESKEVFSGVLAGSLKGGKAEAHALARMEGFNADIRARAHAMR